MPQLRYVQVTNDFCRQCSLITMWEKYHIGMTYKGVTQRCFIEIQMFVLQKKLL